MQLVLCGSVLRPCAAHDVVAAAAAGSFDAVSLWGAMVRRSLDEGWSLAALRGRCDELGIAVDCVEPVRDWVPGAPAQDGLPSGWVLETGAALGARVVLASTADAGAATPGDLAAFGARAADLGLVVGLEFVGWGAIRSLRSAWSLVEATGRPDVGLVYDTWHQRRGTGSDADISAVPAERIVGIQLADGPSEAEADPVVEARYRRQLPGDGAMDVAGQLRRLLAHHVAAPVGVEVWREGNDADPVAAARSAMAALRRVIAQAAAPE